MGGVSKVRAGLMAGLQSCHTWLFVQQGHCSIPLMHGAVGDARCADRQRAVDDGLPLADVLWVGLRKLCSE